MQRRTWRHRLPLSLAAALAAALLLAGLFARPAGAGRAAAPRGLEIVFVDVEGGAATLMVTPAGESLLVDCGWPGRGGRDAERIARAARELTGVTRLDHLVITHWHTDHYGGLEELAKRLPIGRFWDRGIPETLAEDPAGFQELIRAYRAASGGNSTRLDPGSEIPLRQAGARLELRVLAARGRVVGEGRAQLPISCERHPAKPEDTSDNARSLALLLQYGRFRFLNCGDLTWNIEHKLACPRNRVGRVELMQVTHHGADSSNNPALLEAAAPRCAVMCNGPRKGGAAATVAALRALPEPPVLFQLHRNVQTKPEENAPESHIANLAEECEGVPVRVRVNPGGTKYSVAFGGGAPRAEFRTR
jgi:competence protein ComEC